MKFFRPPPSETPGQPARDPSRAKASPRTGDRGAEKTARAPRESDTVRSAAAPATPRARVVGAPKVFVPARTAPPAAPLPPARIVSDRVAMPPAAPAAAPAAPAAPAAEQPAANLPNRDPSGRFARRPPVPLSIEAHRLFIELKKDSQPIAGLPKRFPHVFNRIAATWHDPPALLEVLDDLLVDKRGGRRGFPADVLAELLILRSLVVKLSLVAAPRRG
jgi:hypothetical protein